MSTLAARKSGKKVSSIAAWYGSNRSLARAAGEALRGCDWVGVGFAGGMPEIPFIEARTLQVNDVHRHLINLARVIKGPATRAALHRHLKRALFHPDELKQAQSRCALRERCEGDADGLFASGHADPRFTDEPDVQWAADYFIVCWMSRHSSAGQKIEFTAPMSIRWNANGGDSNAHFRGAVREIFSWGREFTRCNFTTEDAFDFLDRVYQSELAELKKIAAEKPHTVLGLYLDPPFPGPGDLYKHTFGEPGQRRLAKSVSRFTFTRIVCRFYDHPLVRELYPESAWTWRLLEGGKKQTNDDAPEVLLIKRGQEVPA